MKRYFRELVLAHKGRAAIVLGGGTSGYWHLQDILDTYNPIRISANLHGEKLLHCDYIFAIDDNVYEDYKTQGLKTPVIAFNHWADIRVIEYPKLSHSGHYAVWAAWNMGCYPIFVFGMDCYTQGTYFHDESAFSLGNRIPLSSHLQMWNELRRRLPDKAVVRMMGGPVPPIFPEYDPKEVYPVVEFPERLELLKQHKGKRVKITRPARVGAEPFQVGDVVELCARDAGHLIEQHRAIPASVSQ